MGGQTWDEGDAHSFLNQALDCFQGRHLHRNVQRGALLLESLHNFFAIGRRHVVRDERFGAQLTHRDDLLRGQRMIGRNNQSQFIRHDGNGLDHRVTWFEGNHANLYIATEDLARDATGQTALYFNLDVRVTRAKDRDQRQQAHHCVFVGAQRKFSSMQVAELANR